MGALGFVQLIRIFINMKIIKSDYIILCVVSAVLSTIMWIFDIKIVAVVHVALSLVFLAFYITSSVSGR